MRFAKSVQVGLLSAVAIGIVGLTVPVGAQTSDAASEGMALFEAQCSICHATAKNQPSMLAPNLFGVVGRKAGSAEGFAYSAALKDSSEVWSTETLNTFLTAPSTVIPGTRMTVAVPDDEHRAEIIAYLATLK